LTINVERLGKFGLEVSSENTRILLFSRSMLNHSETFDFLKLSTAAAPILIELTFIYVESLILWRLVVNLQKFQRIKSLQT
jgi:hypothetical protein